MSDLLPCPFCGGPASLSTGKTADGKDWHYIECETLGCGAIAEPDAWDCRVAGGGREGMLVKALVQARLALWDTLHSHMSEEQFAQEVDYIDDALKQTAGVAAEAENK